MRGNLHEEAYANDASIVNQNVEGIRSLDHALILVAKNDPERRQIVEVLEKKPNLAEVLDKPTGPGSN